jgi:hypothetical protein
MTSLQDPRTPARQYFHGFDYLRPILMLAVVLWHSGVFHKSPLYDRMQFPLYHLTALDVLGLNLVALAVPTFFTLSLFLLFVRLDGAPQYWWKRVERILLLYLFWSWLWLLTFGKFPFAWETFSSPRKMIGLVVTGGGSHFYFFFSLLLLVLLSALACRLPKRYLWLGGGASLGLFWLMDAAAVRWPVCEVLVEHWNPLNFLPCMFVAALMSHYCKAGRLSRTTKVCAILAVATAAAAWMEWRLIANVALLEHGTHPVPVYGRASMVLGAAVAILLAMSVRIPAPRTILLLSECSLGVFCIHPFVQRLIPTTSITPLSQFAWVSVISFLAVIFLRYAISKQML